MTNGETHDRFPLRLFFNLYARYAGEPESRTEVYGYWTFLFGSIVAFSGVLVFLLTSVSMRNFFVREVSITLASFGLAVTLLGILLLFPLKRIGVFAAIGGTLIALGAVIGFVFVYPRNWVGGLPDYSDTIIAVYTFGIAIDVAVAALVPVVTGERSLFLRKEYERGADYPDVMIGKSLRGGVYSIYRNEEEWGWRLIEQEALAGGTQRFISRLDTEEMVDRVKQRIGAAGFMEIKNAAFRLYKAAEGRWRWLLLRDDGSVVADSGDTFETRSAAETSVNQLKELGPSATLLRIDGAAFDYYTEAGEWRWRLIDEDRTPLLKGGKTHDSRSDVESATEMVQAQAANANILAIEDFGVELFEDDGWRWRLVAASDSEVAISTTSFDSRRAAEAAVSTILDGIADAPVTVLGDPAYEVTPSNGGWQWQLVSGSEQVVAQSHEVETESADAVSRAEQMAADAADATILTMDETDFEYYRVADQWRWRLVTEDRDVIAESATSFDTRESAESAIDEVKVHATKAELIEYQDAAFQVYQTDEKWRWRLIDEDGNVLADSGTEHESRDGAMSSMMTVKENAPNADLLEIETAAFELFERNNEWNWRLVDEGGDVTAQGSVWHDSRDNAQAAMDRLAGRAPESPVRSMEGSLFQLYTRDDDWLWRFIRPDGTVLADSTVRYGTRDEAERAIDEDIRVIAATNNVHTIETVAVEFAELGEGWEWRLRDPNREQLARSSSKYADRDDAVEIISAIQQVGEEAVIFERKDFTYLLTREKESWRWRLVGADRSALAVDPHTYEERAAAESSINRVRSLLPDAGTLDFDLAAFELYEEEGEWYWRLIDEDGTVIAAGTEGYDSRDAVSEGVETIKSEVTDASIFEIDTASFELHEGAGEWSWRLVDGNGAEIAKSLTTFSTRRKARESMKAVQDFGPDSMTQIAE